MFRLGDGARVVSEPALDDKFRPLACRDARSTCGDEKRANRATAFQGVCACVLLSLLTLSISSSS
jgi:hypothetical protein